MKITTLAPDASGLVEWPTLSANRKSVVTVGVFDGMHRGHQAVIRRAVELAKADKALSVVVMFDPRPGVVHAYAAAHDGQEPGDGFRDPMALTSVDQRLRTLENLGVDHVLIVRYTLAFAAKSYRFFLGQMVGKLGMRTLVLGTDAAMGANRAGDVKAIGVLAQATGVFELEIVDDRGPGHVRVPADVTPQMPSEPGEPVDPTEGMTKAQLRAWSNVANYGVMQYQNSVLILFQDWHDYPVGEQLLFRERWDELLTLLGKNHAHIGVSLLFTELGRLRMGYDQARTAIEIGRKLDPDALEYHYSKYYLNDMLECYREKFALDDVIVRYLDQLAGERGYSNSNLLLLYHYLNTERNISLTAKRVHMHRNSVIYRLQRIQDVLNLDLDDPDVRLRLMITFKILRMEGKLPEITDEPPEPDNGGSDRLTLVE